jgi:hypothetical protein
MTQHSTETSTNRAQATEIAGTLKTPLVRELATGDGEQVTYHWATEDGRHTFAYLTFRRAPDHAAEMASSNIDSEDVRGQGNALWNFVGNAIQGRSNDQAIPIIHEVKPNDYSRRLPESDPRYVTVDNGQTYLGLYRPELPKQPGHDATTHALGTLSVPSPTSR